MQPELTADLGRINESALMGFNSTRLICSGKPEKFSLWQSRRAGAPYWLAQSGGVRNQERVFLPAPRTVPAGN